MIGTSLKNRFRSEFLTQIILALGNG